MKIQKISTVAFALVAVLGCMVSSAAAQQQRILQTQGGMQQAVPQTRVAPAIAPMPNSPRLGFMGQMIYGYGMRVLSVNWGSPASQLGLERGDVIFSINGRRILSQFDYDQALQNAAIYRGGVVALTVRNIRFDYGQSFQEFVHVTTVLPGYGGGFYPVAGAQAGPVAARSANRSQGQSQGIQVQGGQFQMNQGQNRSSQTRTRVKEINKSQVPALKSTDTGSGQ